MILETQISKKSIIFQDVGFQISDLWFVLEVHIALDESPIHFHNLAQGEMLPWCFVESTSCLD